ncbi:MAG TPA: hypothetical protein VH092_10575 [Urbifossiella sp.]|jgi:hypothetical protein|nr:hypothetical protein [Urbifossiella sp.]
MAHFPKPFFRPKKNRWYVQLDGKQVNLGPDEAAAVRRYNEVMAERGKPAPVVVATTSDPALSAVLDEFLTWCLRHRERRTSNASSRSSTHCQTNLWRRKTSAPSTYSSGWTATLTGTPA